MDKFNVHVKNDVLNMGKFNVHVLNIGKFNVQV